MPLFVERVMGIEPTFIAWEAIVLPLDDTRLGRQSVVITDRERSYKK